MTPEEYGKVAYELFEAKRERDAARGSAEIAWVIESAIMRLPFADQEIEVACR